MYNFRLNLHFSVLPGKRWRMPHVQWPTGTMGWCPPWFFFSSLSGWSVNSTFALYSISFSIGSVLSILLLSHWLSWGNFVACRWVFSNQVQAFLFFNKALVCFRQNLNSWQNIKSLIARVSFFSFLFSWRYHRLGYGFGLAVGWRKEAFLTTWRCWRFTDKVTK